MNKEQTLDKIIAYESGELDRDQTIELFQELLDSGLVWSLQGTYGRNAQYLLEQGLIQYKQEEPADETKPRTIKTKEQQKKDTLRIRQARRAKQQYQESEL